ncbi:MAG: type II secretion system minor pseudopilin GspK [Deltaproteobacteria bacterium]|nr:type II secretion system minor pseudopilin GspK [Deltaproteobacteria bacterium]
MRNRDGERGVALLMVVLVITLLTAVIIDFSFRTRLDSRLSANVRDTALASALSRSGYEIALSLLLDDAAAATESGGTGGAPAENTAVSELLQKARDEADATEKSKKAGAPAGASGIDTLQESWARMDLLDLQLRPNESLRVEVDDLAGRVNVNAIIIRDASGAQKLNRPVFDELKILVQEALDSLDRKDEGEIKDFDGEDFAYAVADWVDGDETRLSDGSFEDQYYNSLKDAYSSKNGPFDSVAELQLVEGVDDKLFALIRDAVTVYPFDGGGAINVNTAPERVLRSIGMRENDATSSPEPLSEESVGRILDARKQGIGIADLTEFRDLLGVDPTTAFSPTLGFASNVFRIRAVARVNESRSRLDAVIERKDGQPRVLYWRMD